MGMVDNMLLKEYQNQPALWWIAPRRATLPTNWVRELNISTPSIHSPCASSPAATCRKCCSGARSASDPAHTHHRLSRAPGLDINSSMTIYRMLNEQKQKRRGRAVHRRGPGRAAGTVRPHHGAVRAGRVTGIVDAQAVTKEQLGLMMTGASMEEAMQNGLRSFPCAWTRRADISTGKAWLVRLCAILLALLTGGVFVAILGYDPAGRLPGDDLRLARLAHGASN